MFLFLNVVSVFHLVTFCVVLVHTNVKTNQNAMWSNHWMVDGDWIAFYTYIATFLKNYITMFLSFI